MGISLSNVEIARVLSFKIILKISSR